MGKKTQDYRLVRHGLFEHQSTAVELHTMHCPLCKVLCEHNLYHDRDKGRPIEYLQCQRCKGKHHVKYLDTKGPDERSLKIQALNIQMWGWLKNRFEDILTFHIPEKMHVSKGVIGHSKRNKDKPAFNPSWLHPEFMAFLETPEAIMLMRKALDQLYHNDRGLYYFIYLRARGATYNQINEALHGKFVKSNDKRRVTHGGRTPTDGARIMNNRALCFMIDNLPTNLSKHWGMTSTRDALKSGRSSKKAKERERILCPRCDGSDSECCLCRTEKRKGDGTVPRWLAEKYRRRIENGGTWMGS